MANHLSLADHFSTDELHQRYRAATDPVERTHWQIIWLKSQGRTTPEIAALVGYSENWTCTLIHRYNAHGAEGLKPILRRVWARRGQRPHVLLRPRYEWLYV